MYSLRIWIGPNSLLQNRLVSENRPTYKYMLKSSLIQYGTLDTHLSQSGLDIGNMT